MGLYYTSYRKNVRGIGTGFYPLPPTPPRIRVRTGRLPRTSDRSWTSQPKKVNHECFRFHYRAYPLLREPVGPN